MSTTNLPACPFPSCGAVPYKDGSLFLVDHAEDCYFHLIGETCIRGSDTRIAAWSRRTLPDAAQLLALLGECDELLMSHHSSTVAGGWEGDCPVCGDTGKPNIARTVDRRDMLSRNRRTLDFPLPD